MPNFRAGDVIGGVVLLLTVIISVSHCQSTYVCPKKFLPIGKKCYHFSKDESSWLDAHFRCSGLNGTLATISGSHQELRLRRFMNRRHNDKFERWLGGRFNEKQGRWIWGKNGKPLTFHGFSRMNWNDQKWALHCIIVDPVRQYKWGARNCITKRRYICQRRAYARKNSARSECDKNPSNRTENEICSKKNYGPMAPAFLVKKPKKKYVSYYPATFVCPSHMILVGRKCYFFSTEEANWSDSYWACRDNNSKLANIVTKMQDNILKGFLNGNFTERHERWIGGIYDWKQMKWKWAMSGREIKYKNFARVALENANHTQHCITLDPQYNHRWNSRNRLEKKHYICQARSKSVVKLEKPYFIPDATVVIQVDNNDSSFGLKSTTEPSPSHYKHSFTDKYIYN